MFLRCQRATPPPQAKVVSPNTPHQATVTKPTTSPHFNVSNTTPDPSRYHHSPPPDVTPASSAHHCRPPPHVTSTSSALHRGPPPHATPSHLRNSPHPTLTIYATALSATLYTPIHTNLSIISDLQSSICFTRSPVAH